MVGREPSHHLPNASPSRLELPILVDTLDRPVELLAQRLGEEALDGDVELLGEDDGQAWVDVVLMKKKLAKKKQFRKRDTTKCI